MSILWFETDTSRREKIALKFDNVPLRAWGLSVRALNALLRHNPNMTIGDVIRADASIAQIRNIGKKCIKELDTKVSELLTEVDDNIKAGFYVHQSSVLWFETDISRRNEVALKFDHLPLQAWGLPARTLTILLRHNPSMTVGDVIRANASIADIRGIGKGAIRELDTKVWQLLNEADNEIEIGLSTLQPQKPLSESVRRQSIDQLHLNVRVQNALVQAGITTIGELLDSRGLGLRDIPRLGQVSLKAVNRAMVTLRNSLNQENEVDWLKYWRAQGVQLLPKQYKPGASSEQIVRELSKIIKEILYQDYDERTWIIIQRRFGLEATEKLTLEDLGDAFGLTRERIRQIEEKALRELRKVLVERQYAGKNYRVHPEILLTVQALCSLVATETKEAILETELLDRVRQTLNIELEKVKPSLFLVFVIAGIEPIEFDSPNLVSVWGYIDPIQRRILKRGVERLDHLLTRETSLPMTEFDILLHINKGVKKSKKLTLSQLRWLIGLCSSIELREDGSLWAKFECLKGRGNQIERLLTESDHPMSVKAIARKINHRLVPYGQRKVQLRTLANQIYDDGRFIAVGRSGQWGLKSWLHIDTSSIVELMEEYLITCNKPATVDEIYAYVSERRPVSKNSIDAYLSTESIFARIDRTRWGLAIWSEAQNARTWNPDQVSDFVAGVFKEHRVKRLDYKIVKQALMDAAGVSGKQAQGLLNFNPVIKTHKGTKRGELYAVFQPNYKEELAQAGGRFTRKKTTLRQQVGEAVRRFLEVAPGKQMALAELIARLQKEYNCPDKTLYHYIADLDYVERIDVPGSRMKVCRIEGTREALSFPQVRGIANDNLRQKIERTLSFLNEEDVDIGLFLLSKEFEATLKTYLLTANVKGKLKIISHKAPDKWRLVDMVDCAKENGIITDHAVFHFLRQERNARAHGTMPALAERRVLMNSVQYIAGMYIDYIKLLDDHLNNLK
jgi:hypothetical protein